MKFSFCLLAVGLANLVTSHSAEGQNWPRFRGPNGSGVSELKGLPLTWTEDDYAWKAELPGIGHSSPVVWDKQVFVTSADVDAGKRFLLAIDSEDGRINWKREIPFTKYRHHKNNSAASNTPAVDANGVYVLWQAKDASPLVAFDHNGQALWTYDLGPYLHGQGPATSPIVHDGMVLVCNDHKSNSFLLAVDAANGKEVWKVPREGKRACYATPCIIHRPDEQAEIVFSHCFEGIIGVDPHSGTRNWHIDVFGTHSQRAVGSPIVWSDLILANSGARTGEKRSVAIRPGGRSNEVSKVYEFDRSASPHVPTLLAYRNRLYLWTDMGILTCADATSGEKIWQARVGGNYFSSPIAADGRILNVQTDGTVMIVAADDEYRMLAKIPLGEASHATPAAGAGKLIFRTQSSLFALSASE